MIVNVALLLSEAISAKRAIHLYVPASVSEALAIVYVLLPGFCLKMERISLETPDLYFSY